MTELTERWRMAARDAGEIDDRASVRAGQELLARWREPHRRYHMLRHLTAVLDVVDAYAALAARPDLVQLAAWCHDAVYDPRACGDADEWDSAALAGRLLTGLGLPAGREVPARANLTRELATLRQPIPLPLSRDLAVVVRAKGYKTALRGTTGARSTRKAAHRGERPGAGR